jgi:predicted phage-related endonuclease
MTIKYHKNLIQGSEEWHAERCGLLTASEFKLIMTPKTLKYSSNDKERSHVYEIMAQRVTNYVEPSYIGDHMLRGWEDEIEARLLYSKHYEPVEEVGFVTREFDNFTLGYSPDGLVGDDGLIECKSRLQKHQMDTILTQEVPDEHKLQLQAGLLITGRKWIDYVSYCAGLPMVTIRVLPDDEVQIAMMEAAHVFEGKIATLMEHYEFLLNNDAVRLVPTERKVYEEEVTYE